MNPPSSSVSAATSFPTATVVAVPPSADAPAAAITSTPRRASTTWPAPVASTVSLDFACP